MLYIPESAENGKEKIRHRFIAISEIAGITICYAEWAR
jgi:hypothetical protein